MLYDVALVSVQRQESAARIHSSPPPTPPSHLLSLSLSLFFNLAAWHVGSSLLNQGLTLWSLGAGVLPTGPTG